MRVPIRVAFTLLMFSVAVAAVGAQAPRGPDQQSAPRGALPADPVILTRLEALLAMPDTLLTTDVYHIDTRFGPNIALDAVVVTVVDQHTRMRGIRIGLRDDAKPVARAGWSFLDLDEAVSLSHALAGITEIVGRWTGREEQRSTDLSFTSVGGFAAGVHQVGHLQKGFLSSGFIDPVHAPIEITDFIALKTAVDQALVALADKGPESR